MGMSGKNIRVIGLTTRRQSKMIEEKRFFIARCDECKHIYSENETGGLFEDKEELLKLAIEDDGWQKKGEKLICQFCQRTTDTMTKAVERTVALYTDGR